MCGCGVPHDAIAMLVSGDFVLAVNQSIFSARRVSLSALNFARAALKPGQDVRAERPEDLSLLPEAEAVE